MTSCPASPGPSGPDVYPLPCRARAHQAAPDGPWARSRATFIISPGEARIEGAKVPILGADQPGCREADRAYRLLACQPCRRRLARAEFPSLGGVCADRAGGRAGAHAWLFSGFRHRRPGSVFAGPPIRRCCRAASPGRPGQARPASAGRVDPAGLSGGDRRGERLARRERRVVNSAIRSISATTAGAGTGASVIKGGTRPTALARCGSATACSVTVFVTGCGSF
jgi:hypothetical protein